MRAVVTGANRGIGLALVEALLARGDEVVAGTRRPNEIERGARLTIVRCDVTNDDEVRALAEAAGERVDLLVNNAGTSGGKGTLAEIDLAAFEDVMRTNVTGVLRVTRAIAPALRRARGKILNVSSQLGSIARNQSGGNYSYKTSKAALNMITRGLANELAADGVAVLAVHPGWVRTRMGGDSAPVSVEDSARGLLAIADALTLAGTGRFVDYQGTELPW